MTGWSTNPVKPAASHVHQVFAVLSSLLSALLRPLVRILVGLIAIPLFRLFAKRFIRWDKFNAELTKDIEQWVRGSLLLLLATANVETALVDSVRGWIPTPAPSDQFNVEELLESHSRNSRLLSGSPEADASQAPVSSTPPRRSRWAWISLALRLLLAVGVIEAMPDQALFSIIHPGPGKLLLPPGQRIQAAREQFWPLLKGILCRHLDRSSSVLAILSVIIGGRTNVEAGWICYFLAILQFLVIGLVSSRDKAIDVLSRFDAAVQRRREQFDLQPYRHD
jgi:hypothetical protein